MGERGPGGNSRPPSVPISLTPTPVSGGIAAVFNDPAIMSQGRRSLEVSPARPSTQAQHPQQQQLHSPNFPQSRQDRGSPYGPSNPAGPTANIPGSAQPQAQDRHTPFNMAAMGASLPQYPPGQQPQFAAFQNQSMPPQFYQFQQQSPQFSGQATMQYQQNPVLQAQFAQQYHPMYQQQPTHPQQLAQAYQPQFANPYASPPLGHGQGSYQAGHWAQSHQQQNVSPVFYHRPGYAAVPQGPAARGYGSYQMPQQQQRRLSLPLSQRPVQQQELDASQGPTATGDLPYMYGQGVPFVRPGSVPGEVGRSLAGPSSSSNPSMPRGPPRKPKQSGHALWVGNLPPGTRVVELKDHFSKDATSDIESVFLISKSNCAFVNYRSEPACAAAMSRFHDSRFQGVRLVCRLRRSAVTPSPTSGGPSTVSPAALLGGEEADLSSEPTPAPKEPSEPEDEPVEPRKQGTPQEGPLAKDKYFVVKSLTMEDLELSVRNGVWATQSHNEAALNKAYETAENVYLIFSANKSGEYFGYARMASAINAESSAAIDWAPRTHIPQQVDLPKAIPTPATDTAPKGRIIDDSARGTIFWEAESPDDEARSEKGDETGAGTAAGEGTMSGDEIETEDELASASFSNKAAWGNPFKIEWLSTSRLPFYRTRGLRNPWNANREVKIARDGTELEPSVGQRLLQMFHRAPQQSNPVPGAGGGPPHGAVLPVGMQGPVSGMVQQPQFKMHPPY